MKKLLILYILIPLSSAAFGSNKIDFIVANNSGIPDQSLTSSIERKVEYTNRLFADNNLLVNREIGSIKYLRLNKPINNLSVELAAIATSSLDGELFGKSVLLEENSVIQKWLNEGDNYKVIMVPQHNPALECGVTYYTSSQSFSLIYFTDSGNCNNDWVLAHELGHQDGLVHEEDNGDHKGGMCSDVPSLMHSGSHGERSVLYGNPDTCMQNGDNTAYAFYKKESASNKAKGISSFPERKPTMNANILLEEYLISGQNLMIKLLIHNPTNKVITGHVSLKNRNLPVVLESSSTTLKNKIRLLPNKTHSVNVSIPIENWMHYGSSLGLYATLKV